MEKLTGKAMISELSAIELHTINGGHKGESYNAGVIVGELITTYLPTGRLVRVYKLFKALM